MLVSHLLIKIFGGFWKVKSFSQSNSLLGKILSHLYNYHLTISCSYIGKYSKFTGPATFPHGIKSIFISGEASIGENAIIYQQVTIGSNNLPDSKNVGAPIIGNNVLIGAGAKIIGNVRIGNNCRIGANAIVVEDIPDNAVVVMSKPKIIIKENVKNVFYTKSTNGFWGYFDNETFVTELDSQILDRLNLKR